MILSVLAIRNLLGLFRSDPPCARNEMRDLGYGLFRALRHHLFVRSSVECDSACDLALRCCPAS